MKDTILLKLLFVEIIVESCSMEGCSRNECNILFMDAPNMRYRG